MIAAQWGWMDAARRERLYAGWQQAVAATLAFHVD